MESEELTLKPCTIPTLCGCGPITLPLWVFSSRAWPFSVWFPQLFRTGSSFYYELVQCLTQWGPKVEATRCYHKLTELTQMLKFDKFLSFWKINILMGRIRHHTLCLQSRQLFLWCKYTRTKQHSHSLGAVIHIQNRGMILGMIRRLWRDAWISSRNNFSNGKIHKIMEEKQSVSLLCLVKL